MKPLQKQKDLLEEPMNKSFDIFVDGSCKDNGKDYAIGGWAFAVVISGTEQVMHEKYGKLRSGKQTNNRAELESTYRALLYIASKEDDAVYNIYSDSEVVVNGINGTSGRNANRDIWDQVETILPKLIAKHQINSIESVEAHLSESQDVKHKMNCYVDKLAKQASNSLLLTPVE